MASKIKIAVQRAFVKLFDEEAQRRGLEVRMDWADAPMLHSKEYILPTVLGNVQINATGSRGMLHVYRRFEDVDRAYPAMRGFHAFNVHNGKWNIWRCECPDENHALLFVDSVFAELDGIVRGLAKIQNNSPRR